METKKNRKLHGSVLLTVVFVMAILIVFLFGTLTLALAANNRAHVNYSSAQTGITARTVAESAIKALGNNTPEGEAYRKVVGELTLGQTVKIPVTLSGDAIGTMGHVDDIEISAVGVKPYYDEVEKKWIDRNLLKFTGSATLGGVKKTASIYAVKNLSGSAPFESSGGAGFVAVASADVRTGSKIYGGSYIALPSLNDIKDGKYYYDPYSLKTDAGVTVKDYGYDLNNIDQDAVFMPHNNNSTIQTDLFVCNTMYARKIGEVLMSDKKGLTIWGDCYFNSESENTNYLYSGSTGSTSSHNFAEMPYIFVNGKIVGAAKLGNNCVEKADGFPLNIFCGSIYSTGCNEDDIQKKYDRDHGIDRSYYTSDKSYAVISGNLYCMDEDGNNVIKNMNPVKNLYWWADSVYTKTKQSSGKAVAQGDICSKGNLELKNVTVAGNVRVERNLTIGSGVKVGTVDTNNRRYIAVGGELYYDGSKGKDAVNALLNDDVVYEVYYDGASYSKDGMIAPPEPDPEEEKEESEGIEYKVKYKISEDKENLKGYYCRWNPVEHINDEGLYVNPWGTPLTIEDPDDKSVLIFEDGVLNSAYSMDDVAPLYYMGKYNYSEKDIKSGERDALHDIVKVKWDPELVLFTDEYGQDALFDFYFETKYDGYIIEASDYDEYEDTTKKVPVDEIYPTATDKEEFDGKIKVLERKLVDMPVYERVETPFPYDTQIYPEYAEKDVICGKKLIKKNPNSSSVGLTTSDVVPIEETKIVKTIEEVLNGIANPYNFSSIDSIGLRSMYDDITKTCTKKSDFKFIKAKFEEKNNDKLSRYIGADGNYTTSATGDENNDALYIDESCIINVSDVIRNPVVINPGSSNILVVIKNFENDTPHPILIDDRDGGKVSIYIEGKMKIMAGLYTMKFYRAIWQKGITKFQYNSPGATGYENISSYRPNVFIYGGVGSELNMDNVNLVTANIISPNLGGSNPVGANKKITAMKYDGFDVSDEVQGYILGCFNAKNIQIPNNVAVCYIPSTDLPDLDFGNMDGGFWCKILYYDEF